VNDGRPVTQCGPSVYTQCPRHSREGEFHSQIGSTLSAKTYSSTH